MNHRLIALTTVSLFVTSFAITLECDTFLMSILPNNCLVQKAVIARGEALQFANVNKSSILLLSLQSCRFASMPLNIFVDNPQLESLVVSRVGLKQLQIDDFKNANQLDVLQFYYTEISVLRNFTFRLCPNLIELGIQDNPLTTIETAAFDGLRKLQRLTIKNTRLGRIAAVFDGLVSLIAINLANNSLAEIDRNLFEKNMNLDEVNLKTNNIAILPEDFLNPKNYPRALKLSENQFETKSTLHVKVVVVSLGILKTLFITTDTKELSAYDNQIETLNCTDGDLQVTSLIIYNNSLSSFKCISQMPNLISLIMTKNKLQKLKALHFAKLKELKFLFLMENSILQLAAKAIAPSSQILEMQVNNLVNYKNLRNIFPQIRMIYLITKKWSCGRISQVSNVLNRQKIYIHFDMFNNSVCAKPQSDFWNRTSD